MSRNKLPRIYEEHLHDEEAAKQLLIMKARGRKPGMPFSPNLAAFTSLTKPDYEWLWFNTLLCKYINAWIRGEIPRLMIFMPPRHGKSELTSRRLPAYLHGLFPNDEILAMSYNSTLASDMTIDVQRIMDRPSYKEIFPDSRITPEGTLSKYARSSNEHELIPYENEFGQVVYPEGSYRSGGVGGSFTGRGGKWLLIDDPIKGREDADSSSFRQKLYEFYNSSFKTRGEGDFRVMITHTRWHQDDLAGRLLEMERTDPDADKWTILTLPAVRTDMENPEDPRELGETLWPARFGDKYMRSAKSGGSRDWSSIYQQTPTAEGGNVIQSTWIKYYKVMPTKFDKLIQSWDFAVKAKQSSDYTVGQVWGRIGLNKYLLYQVRGRFSFPEACRQVIAVSRLFPGAHRKLIEAKANGPAVVQTLKDVVGGFIEVEPMGDKVARLNAVANEYESGAVWYPVVELAPWIEDHKTELANFPNGTHDDTVDAASMALNDLKNHGPVGLPTSGHGAGTIY